MSLLLRWRALAILAAPLFVVPACALPSGQSAPLTDVSGMKVTATGSTASRTTAARAADEINALDYASFQAAVTSAQSAGKVLHLPPASYSYTGGTTLTVSTPVIADPGAVLTCSGANVAFSSTVQAPRSKIFASGCTPSLAGSSQQTTAFPEWWGAKGDATGVAGGGTDNTTAIANALNSGAKQISFAPNGNYRFTSVSCACSQVEITGASRDTTFLMQDDPTGKADAFTFTGNRLTLHNISLVRLQQATGFLSTAAVVSGGSGYAVNNTITLAGGTFTTAAVLKVTSVSGGAVTGVSVQTPGSYSAPPKPTQSLTVNPAVAQASTSGSGTGATFKLIMDGPALVRLKDGYWIRIEDNADLPFLVALCLGRNHRSRRVYRAQRNLHFAKPDQERREHGRQALGSIGSRGRERHLHRQSQLYPRLGLRRRRRLSAPCRFS